MDSVFNDIYDDRVVEQRLSLGLLGEYSVDYISNKWKHMFVVVLNNVSNKSNYFI